MTSTQSSSPVQLAETLIAAFSAGDWAKWRAIVTDGVVYQEMGTQRRAEGVDAYLQLLQGWKDAFPDSKGTIRNVVNEGEFAGIPATGKSVTITGINIHRVADGQIQEGWLNWDALGFLQQVGAVPTPGAS
ncbi:MAG: ester cyclase [Caldilineaceae bacterium]|nr:ester cyclase [Caldilineaceae bacterium]